MGQKTLTIRLEDKDHKRVKVVAAEMGITIKELLLRCVERLKKEQQEKIEEAKKMLRPIGDSVTDIWEDDEEIIIYSKDDIAAAPVRAGWWNGCSKCGAHKEEIEEKCKEEGTLEGCKFALSVLYPGQKDSRDFLCKQCAEDEIEED